MFLTEVHISHRHQGCSSVMRQTAHGDCHHQLHLQSPESTLNSCSLACAYLFKDIVSISEENVYFPHLLVAHKLLVDLEYSILWKDMCSER